MCLQHTNAEHIKSAREHGRPGTAASTWDAGMLQSTRNAPADVAVHPCAPPSPCSQAEQLKSKSPAAIVSVKARQVGAGWADAVEARRALASPSCRRSRRHAGQARLACGAASRGCAAR